MINIFKKSLFLVELIIILTVACGCGQNFHQDESKTSIKLIPVLNSTDSEPGGNGVALFILEEDYDMSEPGGNGSVVNVTQAGEVILTKYSVIDGNCGQYDTEFHLVLKGGPGSMDYDNYCKFINLCTGEVTFPDIVFEDGSFNASIPVARSQYILVIPYYY